MHVTLEQPTGARLITAGQEIALPATLRYTSGDPLAVHLDFPAHATLDGEAATWTFARALLDEGCGPPPGSAPCGCGRAGRPTPTWSSTCRRVWPDSGSSPRT